MKFAKPNPRDCERCGLTARGGVHHCETEILNVERNSALDRLCIGYDKIRPLDPEGEEAVRWRMSNALLELEKRYNLVRKS